MGLFIAEHSLGRRKFVECLLLNTNPIVNKYSPKPLENHWAGHNELYTLGGRQKQQQRVFLTQFDPLSLKTQKKNRGRDIGFGGRTMRKLRRPSNQTTLTGPLKPSFTLFC